MKKIPNTIQDRMLDQALGAIGWDPASPEERQAWIDGKMTDEEFDALCDKRRKEHYHLTK